MKGGLFVVQAESFKSRSVIGLVLSSVIEVKFAHSDGVASVIEQANILFAFKMSDKLVRIVVVPYKYRMSLE